MYFFNSTKYVSRFSLSNLTKDQKRNILKQYKLNKKYSMEETVYHNIEIILRLLGEPTLKWILILGQYQPYNWDWHNILTQNFKALGTRNISLICCWKFSITSNVECQLTLDTLTSLNQVCKHSLCNYVT